MHQCQKQSKRATDILSELNERIARNERNFESRPNPFNELPETKVLTDFVCNKMRGMVAQLCYPDARGLGAAACWLVHSDCAQICGQAHENHRSESISCAQSRR
jgi:hypothetical protein